MRALQPWFQQNRSLAFWVLGLTLASSGCATGVKDSSPEDETGVGEDTEEDVEDPDDTDSDGQGDTEPGDEPDTDTEDPPTDPGEFVNDCTEGLNDDYASRSGLHAVDGKRYSDVSLCTGEMDWYSVAVPAGKWLSIEVIIDGNGSGSSDIDLYEVNSASEGIQVSWSEQAYERLAVYNDGSSERTFSFAVTPYESAATDYDLLLRVSDWHEGKNCDSFYSSVGSGDESGPCNRIMQFPGHNSDSDGYKVEHQAHYSNLRREVAYLVSYATQETTAAFAGTNPLALMDMSEQEGETPGTMVSSLRHPEGTHVDGNDIDIAYYQNGADNSGRAVCENDGYFCTGSPTLLDAERTAYFMAKLFDSNHVRVIGVDTKIAAALFDAADDLKDSGKITTAQRNKFDSDMAYGDGWPFHHHHLHFSWDWEDGYKSAGPASIPDGCMVDGALAVKEGKTPFFTMAAR